MAIENFNVCYHLILSTFNFFNFAFRLYIYSNYKQKAATKGCSSHNP
jgi:hypothetical protein